MSSIPEKKYLSLIKLSYDISLKVTRAFTEINVLSKYDNRVSTFLNRNKHDIFHMWNDTTCCQCVSKGDTNAKSNCSLNRRQIEILFEFQGNIEPGHFKTGKPSNKVIQHCLCRLSERSVSLNDFDINLLETLLNQFANLEMDDKTWLSTIREIRNCIAHATSTTEFDPGRLDKWWMKLEGSILGLVGKIPPSFYGEAIESQINALKNSNMEAIYAKKLMDDVKTENMILLQDMVERSDTRIVDCENNIKQTLTENNIDLKRHLDSLFNEKTGGLMRKLEELEAKIGASAKLDPYTKFRSDHDITRQIHVACQVEADDIDELLTIQNLSDPDIVEANESGNEGFKVVNVKQKCILLELTASPEILSSEERLLNAIDQLINQVILAGNLDTRVPGKITLNLTFTSHLSREEIDVFSRVFCTIDKNENIDSDLMNQMQDCSIGTVTRETQTEIITEDYACQVDMKCKQCSMIDEHINELKDELFIPSDECSSDDNTNEEKYIDEAGDKDIDFRKSVCSNQGFGADQNNEYEILQTGEINPVMKKELCNTFRRLKDTERKNQMKHIKIEDTTVNMTSINRIRSAKCIMVIMKVFPMIMQDLMAHTGIDAKHLYNVIMMNASFRKEINKSERDMVETLQTDEYTKIDVSLSYKIIVNFLPIPSPSRQWGANPIDTEIGIGDDIERIIQERNRFVHRVYDNTSEVMFVNFFVTFIDVGKRIDAYLNKPPFNRYAQIISQYKTCDITIDSKYEKALLDGRAEREQFKEMYVIKTSDEGFYAFSGLSIEAAIDTVREHTEGSITKLIIYMEGVDDNEETVKMIHSHKQDLSTD